jgi:hypothetical protein
MMSYDVGQVVYLLSKKDSRIFPAKVVEQICRKTLDGEEISYVVQLPDKKSTCVSLESLSVDVFITLDSLQTHLLNEAMDLIKLSTQSAAEVQDRVFGISKIPESNELNENGKDENSKNVDVDLGDGRTARINLENIP